MLPACDKAVVKRPEQVKKISLTIPVDHVVTAIKNQTFGWQPVNSVYSYQLLIVSPGFENVSEIIVDSITDASSINVMLKQGKYEWCVNGLSTGSNPVPSDTNIITIH